MRARRGTKAGRRAAAALSGALVVGLSGLVAAPAWAAVDPATVDDGLWYYTRTGIAEAHQLTTGEGITIAVLDSVINPDAPDLVGTGIQVAGTCPADYGSLHPATSVGEDAVHGTGVAALIVGTGAGADGRPGTRGVAPGVNLLYYSITPPGASNDEMFTGPKCALTDDALAQGVIDMEVVDAIDQAVAAGADIISISMGLSVFSDRAVEAVLRAYAAGAVVVAAMPNHMSPGELLPDPANLNGVVTLGRHDIDGALPDYDPPTSPYLTVVGPGVSLRIPHVVDGSWGRYALGQGNSFATPWTAGVLALAWSLHPDATANQMIQALVRTTATATGGAIPAHDDEYGYGPVSVPALLAVDPTTLPDENPLLRPLDDPDARPSTAAILEATGHPVPEPTETAEPTPDPEPTTPPAADDDDTEGTAGLPLPILLAGAAVLLAAATAAAVVLRRRSAPATSTQENS